MKKAVTTSIHLDTDLKHQLEHAAHILHRGKNWIINHALRKFLAEIETLELAKEAKRQSLLATQADKEVEDDW